MHIYAKPSEACVKQDKNAKEYTSFQANYISDITIIGSEIMLRTANVTKPIS